MINNQTNGEKVFLVSSGIIAVIIIAIIATASFFVLGIKKDGVIENVRNEKSETDEAEKIKEENKAAVDAAQSNAGNKLRPIDKNDHVIGELNAPVQMIVYSDFECPFCAKFEETIKQVEKEFGSKVAIAFRHFPLSMHVNAQAAAEASECAAEQGKFWEMHDKLFEDNRLDRMSESQFNLDAADLSLDGLKFGQCMQSEKYKDKVQGEMLEARNLGVIGTPTVYINRLVFSGAYPFEDFTANDNTPAKGMKSIIEEALQK